MVKEDPSGPYYPPPFTGSYLLHYALIQLDVIAIPLFNPPPMRTTKHLLHSPCLAGPITAPAESQNALDLKAGRLATVVQKLLDASAKQGSASYLRFQRLLESLFVSSDSPLIPGYPSPRLLRVHQPLEKRLLPFHPIPGTLVAFDMLQANKVSMIIVRAQGKGICLAGVISKTGVSRLGQAGHADVMTRHLVRLFGGPSRRHSTFGNSGAVGG